MFRRFSFFLCSSTTSASSLSSPGVVSTGGTLRARKWLTLHPIEKWTAILDTAKNINTLLDDDLWNRTTSSTTSTNEQSMTTTTLTTTSGHTVEEDEKNSRGAPLVDHNRRRELRAEIQLILAESSISRQDLAPSISGLGFWIRSLMDTQETIARSHLPFATTKRELNALCAAMLDRNKWCRGVVDFGTSGTVILGDDSAQQIAVADMLPGTDLIDAVENMNPVLLLPSNPLVFPDQLQQRYQQLVYLPLLRQLIDVAFAHIFTSLFVDGRAIRFVCANRLLFLLASLVLQHMVERMHCVELVFAPSSSSASSASAGCPASPSEDGGSDTTTSGGRSDSVSSSSKVKLYAAEKRLLDPRSEMSSWVLPFTCSEFRVDGYDSLKSDLQRYALLDRLASYSVLRQPQAIYFDQDSGADIAAALSERIQRLVFPLVALQQKKEQEAKQERRGTGQTTTTVDIIKMMKVASPVLVPVHKLHERWPDEVHTPYVSFFGPRSWETSRLFRKQLVSHDVNPMSGVRMTKRASSGGGSSAFLLQQSAGAAGSSSTSIVGTKSKNRNDDQLNSDHTSNNNSNSAPVAVGRKRRATPGLVDRALDVTFHHSNTAAATTTSAAVAATSPHQNPSSTSVSSAASYSAPKAFTVIGINVDAKLVFRAYPELRTPCGSGNSFRYRSIARCVLRRKFMDERNWCGGPIGDPLITTTTSTSTTGADHHEDKTPPAKSSSSTSQSGGPATTTAAINVRYPNLLLQERVLEYYTGRARPFQSIPVLTAKLGF